MIVVVALYDTGKYEFALFVSLPQTKVYIGRHNAANETTFHLTAFHRTIYHQIQSNPPSEHGDLVLTPFSEPPHEAVAHAQIVVTHTSAGTITS